MRKLATIDLKNYENVNKCHIRHASRAIIIRDGRVLMVRSMLNGDYKLPGGGKHVFEDPVDCLIREVNEETGYQVLRDSIKEFGFIEEIKKSSKMPNSIFKNISTYYICDVLNAHGDMQRDRYEEKLRYEPVFVDPGFALESNLEIEKNKNIGWLKRENAILKLIIEEMGK